MGFLFAATSIALHGERDRAAIGRDLRIADAFEAQHRVDVEGRFLREGARRERQQRDEFTMHTPRLYRGMLAWFLPHTFIRKER